ncbi:MAG: tRNA uracil 4-sulfurtransferase ThiI [Eubacteriales bacterium]|jgi:thiamine biosynthesis protein ThiI|nr:tRNA 4-thiouridine(8) synthase ThiI [Clostridiales bacterium]
MKEVILAKYGEIALKGMNRSQFEAILVREIKERLAPLGEFSVTWAQSTVYIEPTDEAARRATDDAVYEVQHVFGINAVARAAVAEKDIDAILTLAKEYVPRFLAGVKTFKAESKRSDKKFPLTSPQISAAVGHAVCQVMGGRIKVDVNNPDVTVVTEIRESNAYIHAGSLPGAGGLPYGSNGKAMLLLSGGIDSPVAGFMMARRGVRVEAVHFESYPYTSEQARDKVLELASILCEYTRSMKVHVISVTKIQEELRRCCDEDYFTLLLRRSMMRLAERVARKYGASALVTGEAIGQVASQTMEALTVTDEVVNMPVFRPCIGMDKDEIVTRARQIGTFETSVLPYEDCCTVFMPRRPKTRPELKKVLAQESKYDYKTLEDEAFAGAVTYPAGRKI